MRLTGLTIDAFLRIAHLRITPRAPIVLIAGGNEAGKSSVAEAIRIALLDQTPRVKHKKDRAGLIHAGAKQGSVSLELGPMMLTKFVRDGKIQGDAGLLPGDPEIASVCLQSTLVGAATDDDRRALFTRISKVDLSVDTLAGKLIEKGIEPKIVADLRPLLKNGTAAASEKCKRELQDARGAWREITGEAYGVQKAETWAPEKRVAVPLERINLEELHADIAAIRTQRDGLLAPIVGRIEVLEAQLRSPTPLACPHCGGAVLYRSGALVESKGNAADKASAEESLRVARIERTELAATFDQQLVDLQNQASAIVVRQNAAIEADTIKARADAKHAAAKAFERLTAFLGDGDESIVGSLIGAALKPLNERLLQIGMDIGWTPPAIGADMGIFRIDGHAYNLLSESAKWRVDAMLAVLVSELSEYGLMIFDRLDVLSIEERTKFLTWLNGYGPARDGFMAFVMATLKQPPNLASLTGVEGFWLEDGRIA